ncbi:helix-turn-helix domain-containing protein [Halalkalicoccus salilacus]|uniref:helix-turn-helix domain-containing protein n=1 Tax=Halalkalicoccus TaxID=332246 RepID=UPI002F96C08D
MATILECRVPLDEFALTRTFASVPTLQVEAERFVASGSDSAMPFVSVVTADFDAFEAAVEEDPTVESFSALNGEREKRFYRMEWTAAVERVLELLLENGGVLTQASSWGESWRLTVLCSDREMLSRTYESCEENGLSLGIDSIRALDAGENARFGLTEAQHTTLLEAKKHGYYDVPRDATLSELATVLGISHQALSERLRRGHGNLVSRTLSSVGSDEERSPPELLN